MLIEPKSFTRTAMRSPWSPVRMRFSSVVLPAPRNPVSTVRGMGTVLTRPPRWRPRRRPSMSSLPLSFSCMWRSFGRATSRTSIEKLSGKLTFGSRYRSVG